MKITQDHPDLMIADEIPWLWAVISLIGPLITAAIVLPILTEKPLMALLFAGGGALWFLLMASFVQRQQLLLDRRAGTVTLRQKTLWRYRETIWPLADVSGLEREESTDSDGSTYRYVLHMTNTETVPLGASYTNVGRPKEVATRVTAWLDSANARA